MACAIEPAKIRESYKDKDDSRRALVYVAKGAQRAERFKDMVKVIEELIQLLCSNGKELTEEERNLLSVAYKSVVGELRAAHRAIVIDKACPHKEFTTHYKGQIEEELTEFCKTSLQTFENSLPKICCQSFEARVFQLKLVADYWRYRAEINIKDKETKKRAEKHYKNAFDMAERNLEATHPIRLGVALNYSVFHHEVNSDTKSACTLAKSAFNHAIAKLDDLDELLYKDSTLIMQLLRDNLTLWTADSSCDR